MDALQIALIVLAANTVGLTVGFLIFYMFEIKDKRLMGMLYGITSGIMIAMICFDILPEALSLGNDLWIIVGVLGGILLGLTLESITEEINKRNRKKHTKKNIGTILLVGIAIHNVPEGFAMGTLFVAAPENILQLASIICLHSIPEAIGLAIPFKLMKVSPKITIMAPLLLGGIMGVGAIVGVVLSQVSALMIPIALGVAAGIILYIVCEELLPESRKIWNGRMTSVATIIGILLGMMIVK